MKKQISIIIPVQPGCRIRTDVSNCPFDAEVIIVRSLGVGLARSMGASVAKGELIVMLDSDLIVSPRLWTWLLTLRRGTFAMAKNPERTSYSSRVFAIHKDDYAKVGGFDPSLKYLWEDGEFAMRASSRGFKVQPVQPNLYKHFEHQSRCLNREEFVYFNWEYARLFVKFRRKIYPNLAMWFFDMINLKKRKFNLQPTTVRIWGFFFWNIKALISAI